VTDQQPADAVAPLERQLARIGKPLALGQLAPGVVHEINNPLFAILALLEFALPEAEPESKLRERLVLIRQSSLEIKAIVQTLLEFAREHPDERAALPLDEVAREAVELFLQTTLAPDVEAGLTAGPGPHVVTGSRNGLKLVFLSLLTNAQQAMPAGGTVGIAIDREGGSVVAAVQDSGPGVPTELAARIFEPFFTTRGEQGAAGLGLTIARATARLHGGDLELAQPSHGARFVLRLPAAPARRSG
jgi:signal transduction histidine kinase